jgi:hypothetical protein
MGAAASLVAGLSLYETGSLISLLARVAFAEVLLQQQVDDTGRITRQCDLADRTFRRCSCRSVDDSVALVSVHSVSLITSYAAIFSMGVSGSAASSS